MRRVEAEIWEYPALPATPSPSAPTSSPASDAVAIAPSATITAALKELQRNVRQALSPANPEPEPESTPQTASAEPPAALSNPELPSTDIPTDAAEGAPSAPDRDPRRQGML